MNYGLINLASDDEAPSPIPNPSIPIEGMIGEGDEEDVLDMALLPTRTE